MPPKNRITIRGIPEAKDNLLKQINNAVKDPSFLSDIGQIAVEQIQSRTQSRLEEYKQPELKESTKKIRERLIRAGNSFNPNIVKKNRSNLSMSGQLLGALYFTVNQYLSVVRIMLRNPREAYYGIRKDRLENLKNNNEIKEDLEARGRRFFFISEKLKLNLESRIAKALRRSISLYNKINRKLGTK